MKVVLLLSPLALALGCDSTEPSDAGGASGAPPAVVNEQKVHSAPAKDSSFTSFEVTQFRTTDALPDLDVRALRFVGSDLWAGTQSGALRLRPDGAGFELVPSDGKGPVVDFAALGGSVVIARGDHVTVFAASATSSWPVSGQTIAAVATHGADVIIGTDQGVSLISGAGTAPIGPLQGSAVRDLAVLGDVLYVATGAGIRRWDLAGTSALPTWSAPATLPDDDVRAITESSDQSALIVGTALGYARVAADGTATKATAGVGALPAADVRAVSERGGEVLLGHAVGATALSATKTQHRHSLRWTPAEVVTAVALAADGTRFIGTSAGIARHAPGALTLAEKAAALEATTPLYVRMDGFMADEVWWPDPWDHSGSPALSDNDNDGLWTEMQVAAWCFAYATTKDPAFYAKARASMDVMLLQIDVPGASFEAQGKKPGFIARSLVRSDEGAIFDQKKSQPNWHLQEHGGKTYYWKGDTSSDEYTGHFFGIPLFYDLCAQNEQEKADLREHVDLVMSYLVDNGYRLLDLDGEPTAFGDWTGLANAVDGLGPCLAQQLGDCAASFGGEGWLNATEILGFLLAAWHVTGDARYYEEYERLAIDERYAEMVTPRATTLTLSSPKNANHSDHELAILAYFTLLRYEPDATRRAMYQQALTDFYSYEKGERNALEIALMASAIDAIDAEAGAATLREIPMDRRLWLVDNAHRKDAHLSPHLDRFDDPQFESVFPYDEIGELEWNSNLYAVKQGGDGRSVQGVWPFLLPYWSLRYFGALE